jgi:hypothetical protein
MKRRLVTVRRLVLLMGCGAVEQREERNHRRWVVRPKPEALTHGLQRLHRRTSNPHQEGNPHQEKIKTYLPQKMTTGRHPPKER